MIIWFLAASGADPKHVVLVVDATIPPSEFDQEAVTVCTETKHPVIILANKIDRLNQSERIHSLRRLHDAYPTLPIIPFSAKKGEGKDEALALLFPRA